MIEAVRKAVMLTELLATCFRFWSEFVLPRRVLVVVYINNLARLLECRLVYYRVQYTVAQASNTQ